MAALIALASFPLAAQEAYFDPDGVASGNDEDGTNLGGTGTWNTTTSNWWDGTALVAWPHNNTANAIFTYAFPTSPYAIPTFHQTLGLTGSFNGFAEGDQVGDYFISYGQVTGGAITLTAVPEPGTLGLLGLGLGGLLARRLRRHHEESEDDK